MKLSVVLFLSILVLTACGGADAPAPVEDSVTPVGSREAPFVGHGVIEQVDANQLLINHEDIPGFMVGMTMAFPLANEVDRTDLEVGDEIMFRIELLDEGYQIFSVEEVAE